MIDDRQGILITVEGIDGSGKSTLCAALAAWLQSDGHTVLLTKEPGGSSLGQQLRKILHERTEPISPEAEFLLFAADRAQHVQTVIAPALARGTIVISDRMSDSSLAYQGYGRGIDQAMIKQVNEWVMGSYRPTATIYLRIPIDQALDRIKKTRPTLTAFEEETAAFWHRVAAGFETIFAARTNVITADGCAPAHEVAHHVRTALRRYIP